MAGPYTIGNEEWEYLQTLNMCIQLLLVIFLGMLAGYMRVCDAETFVPQSTTFVFYAALPCLVLNALGINIDLYDEKFLWEFIFAFLILRAIALIISFIIVAASDSTRGIGHVAVLWLAMTWISTVILGVPISSAVFDDHKKGAKYGILAGISSFIFQLPFQLFFLECHRLEEEYFESNTAGEDVDPEVAPASTSRKIAPATGNLVISEANKATDATAEQAKMDESSHQETTTDKDTSTNGALWTSRLTLWTKFLMRGDIWTKILKKVVHNPVLWAIAGGFLLTLSTLGPTYLNDKSDDYVPGLGWIAATLFFIGSTVTPVSLFTMGVWMESEGKNLFQMNPIAALVCMISKLVIVPITMIGLALALDLEDEPGRAAVLIAALPISMASFSLANRYRIGEAIMAGNVAFGTLLILPTVIVWNLVMDRVGLFPIA